MIEDLARLTTQDINNSSPVCDSRQVSENFKKRHKHVMKNIENLMDENVSVRKMFFLSSYVSGRGRKEKMYEITRDGFSLLAMGFTGKKALEWKLNYIKAFNFMEHELSARKSTRHIGVAIRKSLTDTIKSKVDDNTNFKHWAYSNYSKLIYKKLFGKTTKKLKEERNVPKGGNLRNFLTIEELKRLQETESKVATYIEMRKEITDDKLIYEEVKKIL